MGGKAEIYLNSLKVTLKKATNWKAPGHDEMHEFWF